jgi:bacillopeptidase F (M6 metalloprotease family)
LEATPDLYDKVARSGSDTTLPYTTNYIEFHYHPGSAIIDLTFDGDEWTGINAYSGDFKMSSNGDAWAWYRFHQYFDLTGLSIATLKFMTQYDIELDWDYGYVEVHDLTMDTWCTLPGINTVDTLPKNEGIDNENCPGDETDWGIEPTGYYEDGCWNAFTGTVTGWYQEEMDLTPFADHEIEIYFTYWTDPYTIGGGWFVDDVEIPELGVFDDFEGVSDWVIDSGWTCDSSLHFNDFEVDLITIEGGAVESIESIILNELQEGIASFELWSTKESERYVVMIVANQPGYTHTFSTGYEWTIVKE